MKRIIYLLPVVTLLMGVQSCCCDKDDDNDSAPVATPVIQPNGDYAVDLGLSVKWATCNVGANTPEECGDYYAWGDTTTYYEPGYAQENPQAHWKEGKTAGYDWTTYKHCNGSVTTFTKYCSDSYYGNIDSDTTLLPADDIAHYKWGGNWRMPTRAELKALLDSCNCIFTTQNGVDGLNVTSKKDSSKSIFLPAAGFRSSTSLRDVGSSGYYWSSSLYMNAPCGALILIIYSNSHFMNIGERRYGFTVRPVCP